MSAASQALAATARRSKVIPLLVMAGVCLGFFALWIRDLGYPSLSGDESFVAILARHPTGEILQRLNSDEPHPPVYYLAMRAWYLLAGGRPEFIVRFPSLLNGLLLLSLVFRLGRELNLRWPAATLAAVMLGLNPQVVLHVREARMYGPMLTSLALAAWIGLRFERLPRRYAVALAAMASLLPLLTHYFNTLFVFALGVWGLLAFDGATRRRWLISQAIAWVLFAIWLPTMGQGFFNPTSLSQGKTWSTVLPPWDTLARLVSVGAFGYRDIPDVWLALIGGVILVGVWLAGSLFGQGRERRLLLLGVAVPLLTYALVGWIKPLFHPKYMLPWLVFVALAVGRLLERRRRLGGGVIAVLAVLMIGPMWRTARLPYDPGPQVSRNEWLGTQHRDLGQSLIENAGARDAFGLSTPDVAHCYYAMYYFDRDLGCQLIPQYPTQSLDEIEGQIDRILSDHPVLWYLDFYNPYWDPNRIADQALARRTLNLGTEETRGGPLRLFTSAETVLRNQHSIGTRFGEVAELEGIWIVQGSQLHVVLVWHSLADHPRVQAKVFVHLVDESGWVASQADGIPVGWTRPLDTWRLNEQLLDVYALSLPTEMPRENLGLRIGLYDPDTLIRLPASHQMAGSQPDDAVSLSLSEWISTQ